MISREDNKLISYLQRKDEVLGDIIVGIDIITAKIAFDVIDKSFFEKIHDQFPDYNYNIQATDSVIKILFGRIFNP